MSQSRATKKAAASDGGGRAGVVVVGSLNIDLVVRTETMPEPGQTVMGQDLREVSGGKGANQAAAAGRLMKAAKGSAAKAGKGRGSGGSGVASTGVGGGGVRMVGRVGDDSFGERLLESLRAAQVDVSAVAISRDVPTGAALILVDRHGQNAIVVAGGANQRLVSADLLARRKAIESSAVLLLQLETPYDTVACAIALAKRAGAVTILDPAPAPPEGLPESLYHVDILTPNQLEAQLISDIAVRSPEDARRAGEKMLLRGAGTVIVKMGAAGAVIVTREGHRHVPGFRVAVVDTTGAGDCFNGALGVALAERRELGEAVRFANAAGALACTKAGAQSSIPTRAEVDALLQK